MDKSEEGTKHGNPWLKSPLNSSLLPPSLPLSYKKTSSHNNIDTTSFMLDTRDAGRGDLGVASKQLLAVQEAFSGDNVVEEFEKEKAELEAKGTVDDTPSVMPGTLMEHLKPKKPRTEMIIFHSS